MKAFIAGTVYGVALALFPHIVIPGTLLTAMAAVVALGITKFYIEREKKNEE